jgi:hypothetical protein
MARDQLGEIDVLLGKSVPIDKWGTTEQLFLKWMRFTRGSAPTTTFLQKCQGKG